ncbi:colorectal cancer-associated protein 2 isoform X2 [Vulpes lagopus]|uniref:colorectal cancer-associated protein 2 isoform X2 n=1 Tax=Vulpes lagopus TaxID=494514 RepID=UPI001BCA630B|nr:colorectal cancer-associated protein 2 isoform X2 [Vulpes lagopus]XP_041627849.1 colorectal cancer-associated protein 2 isoform X2 [Vulpes lagopus]
MWHLCFSVCTGALGGTESLQLQHPASAPASADHDVGKTEGVSRCPGEDNGEGAAAAEKGTPGSLRGNLLQLELLPTICIKTWGRIPASWFVTLRHGSFSKLTPPPVSAAADSVLLRWRAEWDCLQATASASQTKSHHPRQGCILSLNQFLLHPIIFNPENFPVVFPVKKIQAASTSSLIPTFRQRHTWTLRSMPRKALRTISLTASKLPLSALTRAWHKNSSGPEMAGKKEALILQRIWIVYS